MAGENNQLQVRPRGTRPAVTTSATATQLGKFEVSLDPGELLNTRQVFERLRNNPTQEVIIVCGAYDSGKTTLIISLYEKLQSSALESGYDFADSETIVGLERMCFDSRTASGNQEPKTERTGHERMVFYHLAVRKKDCQGPIRSFWIGDIAGERWERAGDSSDETAALGELRRADRLIVVLDGHKLAQADTRQLAREYPRRFLQRFIQDRMLARQPAVDVVFCKWDEVKRAGADAERFVDSVRADYIRWFKADVRDLSFFEIAARPEDSSASDPGTDGIAVLVDSWMTAQPPQPRSRPRARVATHAQTRGPASLPAPAATEQASATLTRAARM
jgi:hypothetical protein